MTDYEAAMRSAIALALRGPATGGNPQVGCVLLDEAGSVVAEGWHHGAGTPHAEVDALSRLPLSSTGAPDAAGLTAVVTLEPCNHTGRTGPCSEALIASGIRRVVYAVADPGDDSSGGAERLRQAGVDVIGGVLEAEAAAAVERWLTSMRLRRPFVTLKWASTLDGRIAAADGTSQWITGEAARQRVHEQRATVDAILVGTGTVLTDDPSLTARGEYGELLPHQPLPVVVGERPVPPDARLRDHPAGLLETGSRDVAAILADLFDRGIRRVLVEGGSAVAGAVAAAGLADEYTVYLAPMLLGGDRLAIGDLGVDTLGHGIRLTVTGVETLGNDLLVVARPAPGVAAGAAAPPPAVRDTVEPTATSASPAAHEGV